MGTSISSGRSFWNCYAGVILHPRPAFSVRLSDGRRLGFGTLAQALNGSNYCLRDRERDDEMQKV